MKGYAVFMLGDFNGHLGPLSSANPLGIEGDACARNDNGGLFLDFAEDMDMSIINGTDVCEGTFTRIEGGRRSIVDYGLAEKDHLHMVSRLHIDERKELAHGSDHAMVRLKLYLIASRVGDFRSADIIRFKIRDDTCFEEYQQGIEEEIDKQEDRFASEDRGNPGACEGGSFVA